jgi:hypothetical protein
MTTEEIQKRIDNINAISGDSESAHVEEDSLREDFIKYVASLDNPSLAAKAKLVLSTNDIGFSRWYA